MMHVCSPADLLASAAFMHHDDRGHTALKHDAALKGLKENRCRVGFTLSRTHTSRRTLTSLYIQAF